MPNPYTLPARERINRVKDALRRRYTFPGGYELAIYLADGSRICRECTLENWKEIVTETRYPGSGDRSWGICGVDIYWEGPPETCCQCGKEMPSEYGDPDDPNDGGIDEAETQGDIERDERGNR